MSEIDSVIESIKAGLDALEKAGAAAQSADIPAEERAMLEEARKNLQAMSDRMYDLAMTQGTIRKLTTKRIELRDTEQE